MHALEIPLLSNHPYQSELDDALTEQKTYDYGLYCTSVVFPAFKSHQNSKFSKLCIASMLNDVRYILIRAVSEAKRTLPGGKGVARHT